jgi:hypothetical protein
MTPARVVTVNRTPVTEVTHRDTVFGASATQAAQPATGDASVGPHRRCVPWRQPVLCLDLPPSTLRPQVIQPVTLRKQSTGWLAVMRVPQTSWTVVVLLVFTAALLGVEATVTVARTIGIVSGCVLGFLYGVIVQTD